MPTFVVVPLLQEGEALTGYLHCQPWGILKRYPDCTGKDNEAQKKGLVQVPKVTSVWARIQSKAYILFMTPRALEGSQMVSF